MGGDGVQAGSTTGVAARDNGETKNKAPRTNEEVGCGEATGATEWGDIDATAACNAAVTGRDAVLAGWSTGWRRAMTGLPRIRPCACPGRLNCLYPALSSWPEQVEYRWFSLGQKAGYRLFSLSPIEQRSKYYIVQ